MVPGSRTSVVEESTVTLPLKTTVPLHVVLLEMVESDDATEEKGIPSIKRTRRSARERMRYASVQAISMQGFLGTAILLTYEEWACPDLNWGLTAPSRQV